MPVVNHHPLLVSKWNTSKRCSSNATWVTKIQTFFTSQCNIVAVWGDWKINACTPFLDGEYELGGERMEG